MARLDRAEKQRSLLRRWAALMLSSKAKTVEELEELDRLESAREAGDPVDPENAKEGRLPKRLRGKSLADIFAGSV